MDWDALCELVEGGGAEWGTGAAGGEDTAGGGGVAVRGEGASTGGRAPAEVIAGLIEESLAAAIRDISPGVRFTRRISGRKPNPNKFGKRLQPWYDSSCRAALVTL